jgi:arginine/lysine/ornithine decarboxylase
VRQQGQLAMGELNDWVKYWRKTFSKCFKIHKDSRPHKQAYAELSDYLNNVEESADREELDATVLWAVKFMQRMHELEKEIGLLVLDKKIPSVKPAGDEQRTKR